jgi:hypothetical protein
METALSLAYLADLRILTPSDSEIEFAMACVETVLARGIVESAEAGLIDSEIRSKLVSLYQSEGDFACRAASRSDRSLH